ncbi:MAG: DUF190 domain-containing protein [Legionella sp.]|nr:DUF190 domain-containing protein [Legionella sp.]
MSHLKVSIYINEADKWEHRPLYLELLSMLDKHEIANGAAWRAIAGFTYKSPVATTSIVDIGSKLPLLVQFVDTVEHVEAVLPQLKAMTEGHLIIQESVTVL